MFSGIDLPHNVSEEHWPRDGWKKLNSTQAVASKSLGRNYKMSCKFPDDPGKWN
jgi:hypothetical protein